MVGVEGSGLIEHPKFFGGGDPDVGMVFHGMPQPSCSGFFSANTKKIGPSLWSNFVNDVGSAYGIRPKSIYYNTLLHSDWFCSHLSLQSLQRLGVNQ
jgi:hypothetical protein